MVTSHSRLRFGLSKAHLFFYFMLLIVSGHLVIPPKCELLLHPLLEREKENTPAATVTL